MSKSLALFSAEAISKSFGDVRANEDISFSVAPGEIHALLGENGAGKSTLVKSIYGVLAPDSGRFYWKGEPLTLASPAAARAQGIGMVFQHFSLFDALTVSENMMLAMPKGTKRAELEKQIRSLGERYGLPIDPSRAVHTLSVGERQRVEIVRVLLQQPDLLILDEPTSVLTPQEADKLFETLKKLAGEGKGILYISHRLDEIKAFCDQATILRHGKVVATAKPEDETVASLAAKMVGEEVADLKRSKRSGERTGDRLSVHGLSQPAPHMFGTALNDISFSVAGGEIVGIAGIAGNGQSELFAALSGETIVADSSIRIDDQPCGQEDITKRRGRGVTFVPEERNGHGAVSHLSLSENTLLSRFATADIVSSGIIDEGRTSALAERVIGAFDVRCEGAGAAASSLSGGNLQKFMVGREMIDGPSVLVINQPTWGVDAGAAQLIRQAILDLAEAGSAILLLSQDLDELFALSHRIAVIFDGSLFEPEPVETLTREAIGIKMGGAHAA